AILEQVQEKLIKEIKEVEIRVESITIVVIDETQSIKPLEDIT
ncbi:11683_t:CDS:1, partial [Scutellospora calospora]